MTAPTFTTRPATEGYTTLWGTTQFSPLRRIRTLVDLTSGPPDRFPSAGDPKLQLRQTEG